MRNFKLFKMLAVLIVLITSINTAWGASENNNADNNTNKNQNTTIQTQNTADEKGTYLYTPNISTQDTLYLKHENKTPAGNWWSRNGWNLIQALLLVILGALMSLLTSVVSSNIERKRKKQEIIEEKAISVEQEIYKLLVELRNKEDKTAKLEEVNKKLVSEELSMRTPLYLAANNILTFYSGDQNGAINDLPRENELFEKYKTLYKENNG